MSSSSSVAMSFARDHLRDLQDLQLFIALVNAPDRWWDARTAGRELQVVRAITHSVSSLSR